MAIISLLEVSYGGSTVMAVQMPDNAVPYKLAQAWLIGLKRAC
jgi:hypothetical protein